MFDCLFDKCPKDQEQCHLWWEMPWENQETGEIRFKKGCILSQEMGLPIVQSIVRAAHVSSANASQANNTFQAGFEKLQELAATSVRLKQIGQEQRYGKAQSILSDDPDL